MGGYPTHLWQQRVRDANNPGYGQGGNGWETAKALAESGELARFRDEVEGFFVKTYGAKAQDVGDLDDGGKKLMDFIRTYLEGLPEGCAMEVAKFLHGHSRIRLVKAAFQSFIDYILR